MKVKFLFFLLFAATLSHAQTKVISHKSHSGGKNSFAKAYKNNLFDMKNSNFGVTSEIILRLDTIVAVNSSMVIIKYRQSKYKYPSGMNYKLLDKSDFDHKIDSVYFDKILNKKNTVQYIRLKTPRLFNTPMNEVVFIGFEKN